MQGLSQPNRKGCPTIRTSYGNFNIAKKFEPCISEARKYYCGDYLPKQGTYGYEPLGFSTATDLANYTDVKSLKALKLELLQSQLNQIHFEKFENLEYLWLSGIEAIPNDIFGLKKLKVLVFESLEINSIPDNIGDLKSLEVLGIIAGQKLHYISNNINHLTGLKYLHLSIYKVEGFKLDYGNFPHLERLTIRETPESPSEVLNKTVIKCKMLSQLSCTRFATYIGSVASLRVLSLELVRNTDDLTALRKLVNLEEFFVWFSYDKNIIANELYSLKKLRNLSLALFETKLDKDASKKGFNTLEYLSFVSNSEIELPDFIYNSKKLKYLAIGTGKTINVSSKLLSLKELEVVACSKTVTFEFDASAATFELIRYR